MNKIVCKLYLKVFLLIQVYKNGIRDNRLELSDIISCKDLKIWPTFVKFAVLNVNDDQGSSVPLVKKVAVHPASAQRILLPDGRYIAYQDRGIPVDKARFTVIVPHGFLSSRLAGIH